MGRCLPYRLIQWAGVCFAGTFVGQAARVASSRMASGALTPSGSPRTHVQVPPDGTATPAAKHQVSHMRGP